MINWPDYIKERTAQLRNLRSGAPDVMKAFSGLAQAALAPKALDGKTGVFWLAYDQRPTESRWRARSINGAEGFIFDLLQLVDLDGDGDLDVITQEEKGPYLASGYVGKELGVIWYENPTR